jgi:hypothetical protein
MKRQPAPDWAIGMAKIPFNPMEARAAFAATSGPRSALPGSHLEPPPLRSANVEPQPLSLPPGVPLLDRQLAYLDEVERAQRKAQQTAAAAQTAAFQKFMEQAAKWDAAFAEFQKAMR